MLCRFSIDFFALKKCSILHIENWTSNKKKSGIKLLINKSMINPIFPTLLKYEIEKWGQWCKFRDKGQNSNLKIRV